MKRLSVAAIAACLLSAPVVAHADDAALRPAPISQTLPVPTFRPAPVPAPVSAAAEELAQACRTWEAIPVPLASSGAKTPDVSDASMAIAGLCNIAEDPADLEAGTYRVLWFGAALGAFGLWTLQILYKLTRAGVALVRRRVVRTVA